MTDRDFQDWWGKVVRIHGYNPDPDNPEHFYDYRKAYDENHPIPKRFQHWDARYKHDLHPNRFVPGTDPSVDKPDVMWWDTKNDEPASASEVLIHDVMRQEYLDGLDDAR